MKANREIRRRRFNLEALEERIALSGMGGVEDGPHHHRGRDAAQVGDAHHRGNDPVDHDANDDNGHHRRGSDDPAGHR